MQSLRQLTVRTDCDSCDHKCCSQPYDWVFLTEEEIDSLRRASGVGEEQFVTLRRNRNTGYSFKTLNLPCRFLEPGSGRCSVYESRPLVCRMFPFYLEPLTGDATLLPVQCGDRLHILQDPKEPGGWSLSSLEDVAQAWCSELWREARSRKDVVDQLQSDGR